MTGDLSKLAQVCDTRPIVVDMPNGHRTIATKYGTVQLNSDVILYDVLYVACLNCKLISIVQLINELFCTVTFTYKLCLIEDYYMGRLLNSS